MADAHQIKNTVLTSDRFGVSDKATTAIASSVLQDFGILTDDDHSYVINKNKLRRDKRVNYIKLQNHSKGETQPTSRTLF